MPEISAQRTLRAELRCIDLSSLGSDPEFMSCRRNRGGQSSLEQFRTTVFNDMAATYSIKSSYFRSISTNFNKRLKLVRDQGSEVQILSPRPFPEPYLHATLPVGDALKDPVYLAGKGQSIVRYEVSLPAGTNARNVHATVSLYSQTLPPYFLADRNETKTPATGRLNFLVNSLGTLSGTDYTNWKLLICSANR